MQCSALICIIRREQLREPQHWHPNLHESPTAAKLHDDNSIQSNGQNLSYQGSPCLSPVTGMLSTEIDS